MGALWRSLDASRASGGVPDTLCPQEGGWVSTQVKAVLVHTFGARCTLGVGHCQGEEGPTGLRMGLCFCG